MRLTWDEYFLELATSVSKRSSCPRRSHGCVIVDDEKTVISTGYNGAPPNIPDCIEVGCCVIKGHCLRAEHAEKACLLRAARKGVNVSQGIAYITGKPCVHCTRALISAGIKKIVYRKDGHYSYPSEEQELINFFIEHSNIEVVEY